MVRGQRKRALDNQVRRLAAQQQAKQTQASQIIHFRLAAFVLAAVISGFVFFQWGATLWLPVTVVVFVPFVALVIWHRRVDTAVTRLHLYHQIKQTHLSRLALDWGNLPPPLPTPERVEHPFAIDLDLVGTRSLHQLLDTAVTQQGSERLRDWLLETNPHPAIIAQRQALVAELTPQFRFRDRLALQAMLVNRDGRFSGQTLTNWLRETTPPEQYRRPLLILSGLAAVNIVAGFGFPTLGLPDFSLITWPIYIGLYLLWGFRQTGALLRDTLTLQDALETAQVIFGFLENNHYGRTPHLQTLCAPFQDEATRPSQYIRRVRRLSVGVGAAQNPVLGFILNIFVPWNLFFAYRITRCRQDLAERLPIWLDVWYELEAINGLAAFTWLNPEDATFPTIDQTGSSLTARRMGHPLVHPDNRVCNDFAIHDPGAVFIITGSNMAGKSTFLRTIGINLALAYAGGPVLATEMHTSLFRLFASIRVADSITDGFSFFYAEVRRLQQLLTALQMKEQRPLLFLIDEIFRGTNNRERLIGSRAYIRALAEGNGLGLIATHDLELVHLAEENGRIHNYHFRDDVADGRMVFDYTLHPGPCPTTNALKIMQLAGLPIGNDQLTIDH
ncbi:MAG TPA: hypothetical protein PLD25_06445 [Chloroflexota bacterium]|nr:hypothetical protein [Chloroflexota bacterium]